MSPWYSIYAALAISEHRKLFYKSFRKTVIETSFYLLQYLQIMIFSIETMSSREVNQVIHTEVTELG